MPKTRPAATSTVHQLKVTLRHIRPPIWRRLQVPSDWTLGQLHRALQVSLGWTNSHLHQFDIDSTYYGDPEMDQELELHDERGVRLQDVAPAAKTKFIYEYDFGDGWEHQIVVEKVLPAEPASRHPLLLAGKRASPPEDCGGPWGYEELLAILANPKHKEHKAMRAWLGGTFDAEAFDLAETNKRVQAVR
jgi:hypothetical protein